MMANLNDQRRAATVSARKTLFPKSTRLLSKRMVFVPASKLEAESFELELELKLKLKLGVILRTTSKTTCKQLDVCKSASWIHGATWKPY